MSPPEAAQPGFDYRFDWGVDGLEALAAECDVVVVVDILRFTSAVSVAVETGEVVLPGRWQDERDLDRAAIELGVPFVLAGAFRNATATARRARMLVESGGAIGVIAAGAHRAATDRSLRPAIEDLLGAGAVLSALDPSAATAPPACSPDARAARAAFLDARPMLHEALLASPSGRELVALGCADDVANASALDATDLAAQLIDGAFVGV